MSASPGAPSARRRSFFADPLSCAPCGMDEKDRDDVTHPHVSCPPNAAIHGANRTAPTGSALRTGGRTGVCRTTLHSRIGRCGAAWGCTAARSRPNPRATRPANRDVRDRPPPTRSCRRAAAYGWHHQEERIPWMPTGTLWRRTWPQEGLQSAKGATDGTSQRRRSRVSTPGAAGDSASPARDWLRHNVLKP